MAADIMRVAAGHIDAIAARLGDHGAARLALMGGLAAAIAPWLGENTRARLVPPAGDALDGALRIARAHSGSTSGMRPLATAVVPSLKPGREDAVPRPLREGSDAVPSEPDRPG
jgi:hypothetical protein